MEIAAWGRPRDVSIHMWILWWFPDYASSLPNTINASMSLWARILAGQRSREELMEMNVATTLGGATRATQFATLFAAAFNYRRKANKRPRCVQHQRHRQRQQRHISASLPTWLTVQLCQPPEIFVLYKKTETKSKNIVENVCSKPWKSMGKLRQARIFRISGKYTARERERKYFPNTKSNINTSESLL